MSRIVRTLSQFTQQEIVLLRTQAKAALRDAAFVLLYAPRTKEYGRILIVIPKKVGNAPVRNKLRRQIKSIFYEEKFYEGKFDWVAIVKPTAAQLSFAHIKELFLRARSTSGS